MDQKTIGELEKLRQELHGLIGKLDAESEFVRKNFQGIGSEHCAARLAEVTKEYRLLEKRLAAAMTTPGKE